MFLGTNELLFDFISVFKLPGQPSQVMDVTSTTEVVPMDCNLDLPLIAYHCKMAWGCQTLSKSKTCQK